MADDSPVFLPDADNETVVEAARARDESDEAVIATDAAGRILYWNERASALYGWAVDEVIGRNILDVTPTRRSGDAAAEIMEEMRGGSEWTGEFIVRRRDGSPMRALVENRVVRRGDVVVGFIGISRVSSGKPRDRAD